ncbi:hypothetical protein HK104_009662 [Borealophlyctis nickersoniae]|nr:hypothetical protein HK104_009662 [Borealophlyctis nickersoniae]
MYTTAVTRPPSSSSKSSSSESAATSSTTTPSHPAPFPRRNDNDRTLDQPIPETLRVVLPACVNFNRLCGGVITIEDLVKVQAMFYWKGRGSYAVYGIRYKDIPPEITEKIYTALVDLGADPLYKAALILWWSLGKGHVNVARALAAAGVDVLEQINSINRPNDWYPAFSSIVYLVEECGLRDFDRLLGEGVLRNQMKCVEFLLKSGADIGSITAEDIYRTADRGFVEVLGLLLDMGLGEFPEATEALKDILDNSDRDKNVLQTIKVLIRGGADIIAAIPDLEGALECAWWHVDVMEFLFGIEEIALKWERFRALIEGVLTWDLTRVREQVEAGANVNGCRGTALRLAIVDCKEDLVKLLLECGANPSNSIRHVFAYMDAQKKMGVAQPGLAILALLMDTGAKLDVFNWKTVAKSMNPAYFSMFEIFLPLFDRQEDLNWLLAIAGKERHSKAVETLLAAGADAAYLQPERYWELVQSGRSLY